MAEPLEKIQQLLAELAQQGPGASVELLLRQLGDTSAQQLRLCAIPHQFDAQILRALAPEVSAEEAQERCERFAQLSMVTERGGALALHDEPRRHLFRQWFEREAEFQAASARLVEYFDAQIAQLGETKASADGEPLEEAGRRRMFHLIGATRVEGLAEFERLCRLRRAELRLSECETLIKLVHEYDLVLDAQETATVTYHEAKLAADRHKWDESRSLFQQVLATADLPMQLQVKTHCRLGLISDQQRQWNDAVASFKTGLALAATQPECAEQVIHLHLNLGSTYRNSGELQEAEQILEQGITLAEAAGNFGSLADGYNSLGNLYYRLNENQRAIDAYEKSLQYLEQDDDRLRSAPVYSNLGNVYADERDWTKSEQFFQRNLEITREAGDRAGQATTLTNLVRIYLNLKQPPQALVACTESIGLFEEIRNDYKVAVAKQNLGGIHRALGAKESGDGRRSRKRRKSLTVARQTKRRRKRGRRRHGWTSASRCRGGW